MKKFSRWFLDFMREANIGRFGMWLGHFWAAFMLASIAMWPIADGLHKNPYVHWFILVLSYVGILSFIYGIKHEFRLCERCIGNMPLDGDRTVQRRKKHLRFNHWLNELRFMGRTIIWLALVFLPNVFSGWTTIWLDLACGPAVAYILVTDRLHRRLYPWCPWCNWGDGGDHECVPDPVVPETV